MPYFLRLSRFFAAFNRAMKRPFLLLEVLIALFIVSLCLAPLIQRPIQAYLQEKALLIDIEVERLADWTFAEVKEKCIKNEIPWSKIPYPGTSSPPLPLPPIALNLPGKDPIFLERWVSFRCGKQGEKTSQKGECFRLLRVDITFSSPHLKKGKRSFFHRLLIRHQSLESDR